MNNKEFPEEGDVLLGTVDRIIRTSVFVKLEDYDKEAVIIFSEVSPGRIRNIRNYVVPGKKIVVKVLRVDRIRKHIDISLRRVTTRDKKQVLEIHKRKKDFLVMLGVIIKDKKRVDEIVNKIKKEMELDQFLENLTEKLEKPKEATSFLKSASFTDDEAEKLLKIITEKIREKKVAVKIKITLSSEAENGVERIKKILEEIEKKAKVNYIGAPYYSIAVEDKNYKDANKKMKEILDNIEKQAKELECHFESQKKK